MLAALLVWVLGAVPPTDSAPLGGVRHVWLLPLRGGGGGNGGKAFGGASSPQPWSSNSGGGKGYSARDGDWGCPQCGTSNFKCVMSLFCLRPLLESIRFGQCLSYFHRHMNIP